MVKHTQTIWVRLTILWDWRLKGYIECKELYTYGLFKYKSNVKYFDSIFVEKYLCNQCEAISIFVSQIKTCKILSAWTKIPVKIIFGSKLSWGVKRVLKRPYKIKLRLRCHFLKLSTIYEHCFWQKQVPEDSISCKPNWRHVFSIYLFIHRVSFLILAKQRNPKHLLRLL